MALSPYQTSAVAKLAIAILLMHVCHLAKAKTLEAHAPVLSSGHSSTTLKDPCPRKFLKEVHGRHLLQYIPPTSPGHSPSIGHGDPPHKDEPNSGL